jgi:hypothetical protein
MTAAAPPPIPWHAYALLWRPRAILANLERLRAAGLVEEVPNLWQVSLGVLRMWHRLIYRTETVGTCREQPVRPTWRARLLQYRAARLPCLLVERAVAPLDFSGLVSPPARIIRHLLGAHHDGVQFVYDLEMLSVHPGKLDELHRAVVDVIERDSRRSRWLRDLVVYEGYHESLREAVERALADGVCVPAEAADDPDLSFSAYIRWCAQQPATPAATLRAWRSGQLALDGGLA